jgi:tetratricopeptide (TPR) repeat protein
MAIGLNNLGTVYYSEGKIDQAEDAYRRSLELHRQRADHEEVARTLGNLAMVFYNRGDYARATAILEETLGMRRELRSQSTVASALNNLGLLTLLVGDYERAIAYCEEAVALDVELGDVFGQAFSLGNLGHAARKLEQWEHAHDALSESASIFWKMGDKRNTIAALNRLAALFTWSGMPTQAARLYGAVEAAREALDMPVEAAESADYEESLTLTRDRLSEVEFNAAWSVGRSISLDEALVYAAQQAPAEP